MELNLFDRNSENGTKRKVVFVGREEESGQYTQFLQSFLDEFKNDTNQKVFLLLHRCLMYMASAAWERQNFSGILRI